MPKPAYIGDSVYAAPSVNDPTLAKIYLSNFRGDESHVIYLEPEVRRELIKYLTDFDKKDET
jgi:hypothetical protein